MRSQNKRSRSRSNSYTQIWLDFLRPGRIRDVGFNGLLPACDLRGAAELRPVNTSSPLCSSSGSGLAFTLMASNNIYKEASFFQFSLPFHPSPAVASWSLLSTPQAFTRYPSSCNPFMSDKRLFPIGQKTFLGCRGIIVSRAIVQTPPFPRALTEEQQLLE